ncbi:T9SS type A sorting domain-containing protein [uncultured Polaribacter sp.]|uniref:T9SS type A sorting domain-containing protein n=1 Tax=uncultured Polaribacter sp. TaxID=174711 RepID=UPI002639020F|nr:T9SS type A sorting domain-containing protein [uncultured Polaribacter sp.]
MIKKITFLIVFINYSFWALNAQTVVNDFEASSPVLVQRYGAQVSVVDNPANMGNNTSAKVAKIGRTTSLWYELIAFDLATPYVVASGETKFLNIMVNYPAQPDVSVRFNAASSGVDGSGDVRALNSYDLNAGGWQNLIFPLDGGASGLTVSAIIFLGDLGFQNDPAGLVLNNTDLFGYVDNFTFTDGNPLSVNEFELNKTISVYPNPTEGILKVKAYSDNSIKDVVFYNILGKDVTRNVKINNNGDYDMSNLSLGMYIVKILDFKGKLSTKKVMKE